MEYNCTGTETPLDQVPDTLAAPALVLLVVEAIKAILVVLVAIEVPPALDTME